MGVHLVLSENDGNSSGDTFFTSNIHKEQLRVVGDGFNVHPAASSAINVSTGKFLG
jgi:hypothetical protein